MNNLMKKIMVPAMFVVGVSGAYAQSTVSQKSFDEKSLLSYLKEFKSLSKLEESMLIDEEIDAMKSMYMNAYDSSSMVLLDNLYVEKDLARSLFGSYMGSRSAPSERELYASFANLTSLETPKKIEENELIDSQISAMNYTSK